ncbi:MAG: hypothetical protein AAGA62_01100, partial [Bacteroidota bacterium]
MLHTRFIPTILLFVLSCVLFQQCKPSSNEAETVNQVAAMPAGLQAHTSGVVGREEALYVQFTDEPEREAAGLLSISPKISGSSSLVGTTLSFTPEESWAAATNYTVKVKVSGQ